MLTSKLAHHTKVECVQQPQLCPNLHCGMRLTRARIAKHMGVCGKQPVFCARGCGEQFTREFEAQHAKSCGAVLLPCGKCGAQVARAHMVPHAGVCPLAELQCPNDWCRAVVTRPNMGAHIKRCRKPVAPPPPPPPVRPARATAGAAGAWRSGSATRAKMGPSGSGGSVGVRAVDGGVAQGEPHHRFPICSGYCIHRVNQVTCPYSLSSTPYCVCRIRIPLSYPISCRLFLELRTP